MPGLGGFSRYELQERIGIGGMAEVFRARAFDASGQSRDVVVKKILPHHNEEAEFRTMFMDEARIAANLDHPNVVRVLDLGRLDGDLFLTMEFVEGTDLLRLSEWMEGAGRRMPIATALYLGGEILKGLHHAHTRVDKMGRSLGIVHRDVTPQNVLVSVQGAVKITDFGIARAANRLSHTAVGTIKGNLLYSSPEQIQGQTVDARSDVYSCGILLHRLLGGRHPFDGDDLPKIYQRALSGDIPPVSQANKEVPTNLDRIIARATALVPDQRFASADELRRALEEFLLGKRLSVDIKALCADVRAKKSGLRAAKPDGRVLFTERAEEGSVLSTLDSRAALEREEPTSQVLASTLPVSGDVADGPTTVQRMPDLPSQPPEKSRAPAARAEKLGDPVDEPMPRLSNLPPRSPARTPAEEMIDAWSDEKTSPMLPQAPPIAASADALVEEDSTTRNPIPPKPATPPVPDVPPDAPRAASTILVPKTPPAPVEDGAGAGMPRLSSRPPLVTPDPDAAPTQQAPLPPPIAKNERGRSDGSLSALVAEALADESSAPSLAPSTPAPEPTPLSPFGSSDLSESTNPASTITTAPPPPPEIAPPPPPPPPPVPTPPAAGAPSASEPAIASATPAGPRPMPPPLALFDAPIAADPPSPRTPVGTPLPGDADLAPPPTVRPGGGSSSAPAPRARSATIPPWEQPGAASAAPTTTPARTPTPASGSPPARATTPASGSTPTPARTPPPVSPSSASLPLGLWKDVPPADPMSFVRPGEATIDLDDAPPVVGTLPAASPSADATVPPANGRTPAPTPAPWSKGDASPVKPAATGAAAKVNEPGSWLSSSRSAPPPSGTLDVPWPELPVAEPPPTARANTPAPVVTPRAKTPAPVASSPMPPDDPPSRSITNPSPMPPPPEPLAGDDGFASAFDDVVDADTTAATQRDAELAQSLGLRAATPPSGSLAGHTSGVFSVAAIRAGRFVVSASHDHSLRVWDLTTQKQTALLSGHSGPVTSVALGNEGLRVVSGSMDQTVRLWDGETGAQVAEMRGHVETVLAVAVAPDGRTALSGGQDRSVRVWDLASGKEQLAISGHEQAVSSLAYSGDGSIAMSASLDGLIQIWNLLDGSMLAMFPTGVLGLRAIALSRDGRRLVFGGSDGKVQIWNVEQGTPIHSFEAHARACLSVALSPDGARIATGSDDGFVRVWNLEDAKALSQYESRAGAVHCVTFALDGRSLVGAAGNRVVLWDL